MRISKQDLLNRVERLNSIVGRPNEPYKVRKTGKRLEGNPGTYVLNWAYGGVQLSRMCADGSTGEETPLSMGYETKRVAYDMINAFISGVVAGQKER